MPDALIERFEALETQHALHQPSGPMKIIVDDSGLDLDSDKEDMEQDEEGDDSDVEDDAEMDGDNDGDDEDMDPEVIAFEEGLYEDGDLIEIGVI